jgi:DNA primase
MIDISLQGGQVHEDLRSRSLRDVLGVLGFGEWKERKGGTEWFGACPVHGPKANRGSFSFDSEGRYHCFSCRVHGKGAIDLVMVVRKVGFQDAVDFLQSHLGNIIAQQAKEPRLRQLPTTLPVVSAPTENPPFKGTYDKFVVESAWLKNRGFTPETLTRYEVFEYNNPARRSAYTGTVMLKIRRYSDGECVGYLSRNIGEITAEKPKYVFPKGLQKSLELFGAWQIKNDAIASSSLPLRVGYVVESPFAVMKFHQLGLPAVSPFGWSVSEPQVEILRSLFRGVVFLPDRNKHDEAPQSAAAIAASLWVKAPDLPDGVDDPESLTHEQVLQLT